jgi:site-specific DNA recombinase
MGTPLQIPAPAINGSAAIPAEMFPVAVLARTSTVELQDPRASIRRQIRSVKDWLPAGWFIAAVYWDIESGAIDLEQRSQGHAYQAFADSDLPRDGGLADLLTEAKAPAPKFAAVVCEDIERSGRDTFNALKLEKELSRQGIPLFATDEPASIEGINSTTVLVRRVKQGVAEWYRLQLREKIWKGLIEHSADGWNIGTVPYGYAAEKVTHPSPIKAAHGLTKTRLVIDPTRGPVVVAIFTWRTASKLAVPTITARLNADPAAYPSPDGTGWTQTTVTGILRNPKYTGYMVFGRKRTINGKKRPVPPAEWLWSPQPSHPALIDRDIWDAAQATARQRGNTRDAEMPTTQPGRRYPLRARMRCNACQRRMHGITKRNRQGRPYSYYICSHDPTNPRLADQYPDHGRVTLREETISQAVAAFVAERLLGPDRKAMLAAALPADAADQAARHADQAEHLRKQLARIDTAERALISELETAADPADPATQAYRTRIRARYAELYDERTRTETALAAAQTSATRADDPTLLDELPLTGDILTEAPDRIKEAVYAAFDIHVLYRPDQHQVTIWATITPATPATITALTTDPRTDHDTHPGTPASDPATSTNPWAQLIPPPRAGPVAHKLQTETCDPSEKTATYPEEPAGFGHHRFGRPHVA